MGGTLHKIAVRVILRKILHCEFARLETLRSREYRGKELLLESHPLELRVEPLAVVLALAYLLRRLLIRDIVVNLGVELCHLLAIVGNCFSFL